MNQKIFSLLKLRFFQTGRLIKSIGIGLILFALLITFGLLLQALSNILVYPPYYANIAVVALLFSIDSIRKDKGFLKSIFDYNFQISVLVFLEYFLLVFPLYFFQIWNGNHFVCLGILGSCALLALISPLYKIKKSAAHKSSLKFLPLSIFELKFYLEKNKWALVFLSGLFILTYWHIAFYGAAMLSLCLILPEVFRWLEPPEMLLWHKGFLREKYIKYVLFTLPFMILTAFFGLVLHWEMRYIILYFLFSFYLVLWLSINFKYARFNPFFPELPGSHIMAMMTIFIIFPGGILITLVYALFQYYKAKKNLALLYA